MRKFTFAYLAVLVLFILVGGFLIFFGPTEESAEIDENQINKTPGLQTMLDVSKIIATQQLENSLINIEVNPNGDSYSVNVELQGNDFVTEESLLKDMYNIYVEASTIPEVDDMTIIWHSNIAPSNGVILTVTMNHGQMTSLAQQTYLDIPKSAVKYEKYSNLK